MNVTCKVNREGDKGGKIKKKKFLTTMMFYIRKGTNNNFPFWRKRDKSPLIYLPDNQFLTTTIEEGDGLLEVRGAQLR